MERVPAQDIPADRLSRWGFDVSVLELNKGINLSINRILWRWYQLTHDMRASPQTAKERHFVTRWPRAKATAVDARYCPLQGIQMCHACPPWAMIPAWIQRLRDNPSVVCLMVVPMWDCSPWWHPLMRMQVKRSPMLMLNRVKGMFNGCRGSPMNAPRWLLTCVVVSGQHWHNKACKAMQLQITLRLDSSIKRYCGVFRLFWALAQLRGFDVVNTSISDVDGLPLELHHTSPSQARNAYSACLPVPQLQGLKFSILLKTKKRSWYKSEARYAIFMTPLLFFSSLLRNG